MKLNEPTRLGWEAGYTLAKFYEQAKLQPERCRTCAFRSGTYANGCETTVMDALKCVMEGFPFNCHEENRPCAGYVALRAENRAKFKVHWPFSDEVSEDAISEKGAANSVDAEKLTNRSA